MSAIPHPDTEEQAQFVPVAEGIRMDGVRDPRRRHGQ
jgi:hypothetical protein